MRRLTKDVVYGWKEGCLEQTYEEPVRGQFREGVDSVLKQRKDTPSNIEEWDQVEHRDAREEVHERQLSNYRADHIHRLESNQLIALESKVLLEACNVRIVYGC